jgi:hypothetical protein
MELQMGPLSLEYIVHMYAWKTGAKCQIIKQ